MKMRLFIALPLILASCAEPQHEQDVRAQLKDPESATFRNVEQYPTGVCGEVNARNSMGGYVGYRGFVVGLGGGVVLEPDDSDLQGTVNFISAKQRVCKRS